MRSRAEVNEAQGQVEGESLDDRDLAAWVELQVELLRSGQATGLDVDNLIEELEGLTKRDERTLGSQLKRVMAHLLKQRYQAERATRSSEDSIANGREEIAVILEQSPSLRRTLPGLMTKNYPRAVFQAARDTRLPVTTFPTQPPFTLAEVLGEEEQPRLWQRPTSRPVRHIPATQDCDGCCARPSDYCQDPARAVCKPVCDLWISCALHDGSRRGRPADRSDLT